jgi:phage/plasmid-associated DNA primase
MSSIPGLGQISIETPTTNNKPKKCKVKDMLGNQCQMICTNVMSGYCDEHQRQYEIQMEDHNAKTARIAREKREAQERYFDESKKYHPFYKNDVLQGYECTDLVNDALACEIFLNIMKEGNKSLIQKDEESLCIFDKKTGLWKTDDDSILREISRATLRLYKMEYNEEKETWFRSKKCVDYSGIVSNRKKVFEAIRTELEDTRFIEKNIETNIGKLLFKDGIYTFGNGFKEGFDSSIVFFHQMERNFPVRDEAKIKEVKHILFDDLFGSEEKGNYMRMMVARAIYGDYKLRKSPLCRGNTASGKGMITNALLQAFPGLVEEFNANNLLYNKMNKDEEQKLMFMIRYKTCRLMISNEINIEKNEKGETKTKFNSSLYKSIVSGGDGLTVRGMNENPYKFKNRATVFLLSNDFPEFEPADDAVKARKEDVWFPKSFVLEPNPDIPGQCKRDDGIKSKFDLPEYQDAVFHVVCDAYNTLVKDKPYFKPSLDQDIMDVFSQEDDKDTFESVLLEKYDMSTLEEDKISFDEINSYLQKRLGCGPVKIGLEFKTLSTIKSKNGVVYKFDSKASNGKRYRTNLKRKEKEEEKDESKNPTCTSNSKSTGCTENPLKKFTSNYTVNI